MLLCLALPKTILPSVSKTALLHLKESTANCEFNARDTELQDNYPANSYFLKSNWSTTTLETLTSKVNNQDHLITMQCSTERLWVLYSYGCWFDAQKTKQNRKTIADPPCGYAIKPLLQLMGWWWNNIDVSPPSPNVRVQFGSVLYTFFLCLVCHGTHYILICTMLIFSTFIWDKNQELNQNIKRGATPIVVYWLVDKIITSLLWLHCHTPYGPDPFLKQSLSTLWNNNHIYRKETTQNAQCTWCY